MITRGEFGGDLRERLLARAEKVLLRVVVAPHFECPVEFTGSQIVSRAEQLVSSLALSAEEHVVLLLLPHSPELFLLQLGLVLQGYIPGILSWPTTRVDPEKYQRNLIHQLSYLPASRLITLPGLAENLGASLPYPVTGVPLEYRASYEKLFPTGAVSNALEKNHQTSIRQTFPDPNALFLQFSGGTTGTQKAIVVTVEMLVGQLNQLAKTLDFTGDDAVVSWLPLYHDMGLIACYWMPLFHGAASLHMAANDWVINPELLLKYISQYQATFCWLPNFSFSYMAQRREYFRYDYSLDSMRAWINCSEPVRAKSSSEFLAAFAKMGVTRDKVQSCYAMAETVFAITQSAVGKLPATIPRDFVCQGESSLNFSLPEDVYVSSGKPLPHTEVRITAGDGSICAQEVAGEIHVRTPCLFSGYWGAEGFQTHSLKDGWHATGDWGFLSNGELFVIGRVKDIVIVGGNNIFPEDVEALLNEVSGIRAGRVVAFGVEDREYGTQSLAVVAEMDGEFDKDIASDLEAAIRKSVLTIIGTAPRYVAVVPHRWIVKSTAGKLSRRDTRERFLAESLLIAETEVTRDAR